MSMSPISEARVLPPYIGNQQGGLSQRPGFGGPGGQGPNFPPGGGGRRGGIGGRRRSGPPPLIKLFFMRMLQQKGLNGSGPAGFNGPGQGGPQGLLGQPGPFGGLGYQQGLPGLLGGSGLFQSGLLG